MWAQTHYWRNANPVIVVARVTFIADTGRYAVELRFNAYWLLRNIKMKRTIAALLID